MKSKEKQSGFGMGMLTMLIGSIGSNLFSLGGWVTYLGLTFMLACLAIVYFYTKSK
jgi:hypothetical protein